MLMPCLFFYSSFVHFILSLFILSTFLHFFFPSFLLSFLSSFLLFFIPSFLLFSVFLLITSLLRSFTPSFTSHADTRTHTHTLPYPLPFHTPPPPTHTHTPPYTITRWTAETQPLFDPCTAPLTSSLPYMAVRSSKGGTRTYCVQPH